MVPDREGAAAARDALSISDNQFWHFRRTDNDFDRAVLPKLGVRAKLQYQPKVVVVPRKKKPTPSATIMPTSVDKDDIPLELTRAALLIRGHTALDGTLTVDQRKFYAMLMNTAQDMIIAYQKEKRRILSDNNQLRTRVHQLKRGGTPVVHASGGDPT